MYEFTFARRIVNLGYYHSVYRWDMGRRFFFSAPRMGFGLIEPQNHLNLLSDFQQPVAQAPGFPPHPDSPELDLSLVTACKQIYQESREIPFKRNISAPLSGRPYVAFFRNILCPMQTSWIRFLTIVLRAEVDGFGTLSHWYDICARPLPNLASVHFITRVFYDSSCSCGFSGEGPVWWNDGYQAPLSPETVHAISDLFRLLIHSTLFTKFEISVDDIEIKTEADTYAREGKPMLYIDSTKSGDKHRSIQEELEFFSLTEEHKKIYIEGFRRRLAEELKELKLKEEQDGKRDDENEGDSEGRED
ncbi:hypothetical protein IWZ03DRAFT_82214 [Phyllosticta citriasiana]|uniref:Uncharacterized protein n=1 Tax=Phyllosticta citriasiana TaxID=595635 RepID=A0ABR1KEI8_9PEZI